MKQWQPNTRIKVHQTPPSRLVHLGPPIILAIGFLFCIALATVLLKLPLSTTSPITWLESLFTATSAVTVTGLVVVDTGSQFTLFGQLVLAIMMQIGGLGIMTFSVVTLISLGGRFGIYYQTAAKEAFGQTNVSTLVSTAKSVLIFAFIIEILGFSILFTYWSFDMPIGEAAWQSFFYTISAFNNAGFAIHSDSLSQWVSDPVVNFTIAGMFICGGLGFTVWRELYIKRKWSALSVYSKLMILGTIVINFVAIIAIYLLESNNVNTLGLLSEGGKWLGSFFQAVTTRTAGFNTLAVDQYNDATTTLTLLLMFIGGGSLSTASGIKLVTFIVLILATYSFLKRDGQVLVFGREVGRQTVRKALAIVFISAIMNWIAIFILTMTENADFLDIVFETTSALGTVGLSRGLTGELSISGQYVIMALMFLGRLGPLTLAYLLANPKTSHLRYPETRIAVG